MIINDITIKIYIGPSDHYKALDPINECRPCHTSCLTCSNGNAAN